MGTSLINLVNEIKAIKGLSSFDEAMTKQAIVLRFLSELRWNIFNLSELRPEFAVDSQNSAEKVDYALAPDSDNMLFIEVKAVNIDLEDWEEKFCLYCYKNNVIMGVLTNGISWWFYLPREKGSWYERKFYSINLIQQETDVIVAKFEAFLLKDNVMNGAALTNAKDTHISTHKDQIINKALPQAWNKLILSNDDYFIDSLNDMLEKICGYRAESEVIAKFLASNQNNLCLAEESTAKILKKNSQLLLPIIRNIKSYDYTGQTISSFTLNGKKFDVTSWKQLLVNTCDELNKVKNKEFYKVLSLKGRKRPYFTKNANELRAPEKIDGTGIFVETNLSANAIVNLCYEVLSLLGYKSNLEIQTTS